MKLEFIIPASPNPAFFSQIAMFRRSLDSLGAPYSTARVVAVFACRSQDEIPVFWRRQLDRVEIELPPSAEFDANPMAHLDHCARVIGNDSDVSIHCNADTMFLSRFDSMLEDMRENPAVAGVMAHYHFPWQPRKGGPKVPAETIRRDWDEISNTILGTTLDKPYRYSMVPKEFPCAAPFYLNFGMIAVTPALFKSAISVFKKSRDKISSLVGNQFCHQIALTLACAEAGVSTRTLPMRFNFPNDRYADELYPSEMENIVMLHYLRRSQYDRHLIFAEEGEFQRFMDLKLEGSCAVFQNHIRKLTGGIYPFPGVA